MDQKFFRESDSFDRDLQFLKEIKRESQKGIEAFRPPDRTSLMPTGDEMTTLLRSLDVFYKLQMLISQLTTTLLWVSLTEMLLQLGLFFTFFAAALRLGGFWLMLGHVPRGLLGLLLATKMPQTHQIIERMDWDQMKLSKEQSSVESLYKYFKLQLTMHCIFEGTQVQKYLKLYTAISVLCYLLDGLNFMIYFMYFQKQGGEFAEIIMLWSTMINIVLDIYFVVTVFTFKEKVHPNVAVFLADTLLGYTHKMNRELHHMLDTPQQEWLATRIDQLSDQRKKEEARKKEIAAKAKDDKAKLKAAQQQNKAKAPAKPTGKK